MHMTTGRKDDPWLPVGMKKKVSSSYGKKENSRHTSGFSQGRRTSPSHMCRNASRCPPSMSQPSQHAHTPPLSSQGCPGAPHDQHTSSSSRSTEETPREMYHKQLGSSICCPVQNKHESKFVPYSRYPGPWETYRETGLYQAINADCKSEIPICLGRKLTPIFNIVHRESNRDSDSKKGLNRAGRTHKLLSFLNQCSPSIKISCIFLHYSPETILLSSRNCKKGFWPCERQSYHLRVIQKVVVDEYKDSADQLSHSQYKANILSLSSEHLKF